MSFRERFARFMYGRYGANAGVDAFSFFLMISATVLMLLSGFLRGAGAVAGTVLYVIGTLLYVFAIYRVFSKNISARARENYKFYEIWGKIKNTFRFTKADPGYKLYKCPGCGKKVRVPRNRGKIEITCRNCNSKFTRYTGKRK